MGIFCKLNTIWSSLIPEIVFDCSPFPLCLWWQQILVLIHIFILVGAKIFPCHNCFVLAWVAWQWSTTLFHVQWFFLPSGYWLCSDSLMGHSAQACRARSIQFNHTFQFLETVASFLNSLFWIFSPCKCVFNFKEWSSSFGCSVSEPHWQGFLK